MNEIIAQPGDREAALKELWQIRDVLSESDDVAAAQVHTLYNALVA